MHGLLPHRRADQQRRGRHLHAPVPDSARIRRRRTAPDSRLQRRFRHISGAESRRHRETPLPQRRNHLPRRRVRLHRLLHRRRHRQSFHFHAHRPRKNARRRQGIFQAPHQHAGRPPRRQSRRRNPRPHHSHRRFRRSQLRQSGRLARPRRPLRRNDLHEFLSALRHRARGIRCRRLRNAAQRARHHDEEQNLPRADRRRTIATALSKIIFAACPCSPISPRTSSST